MFAIFTTLDKSWLTKQSNSNIIYMNVLANFRTIRRLALSLLIIVILISCSVTRKYVNESKAKWGKDILDFEQQDKLEKDPGNAILFAGSSSIRLWSTLKEDVAPYPVIQRGFGGSKFSDLAVFAERIIYPHQFRALVIFEANDITGSTADITPAEVAKLFVDIVRTVRRIYAEQPVFVLEITPTPSRWSVWPTIKQANQLLKEACNRLHNTYFIETSAAYMNKAGEPRSELFIKDKLHQNHEGYLIWGNLVRKKLDEVLHQIP